MPFLFWYYDTKTEKLTSFATVQLLWFQFIGCERILYIICVWQIFYISHNFNSKDAALQLFVKGFFYLFIFYLDFYSSDLLLTHEVPLSIRDVRGRVYIQHLEVQQPAVVRPRAEFQVALLHVEGEPANVDVAGALQDAGGDVLTVARRIHQHVGVESSIETLVRTEGRTKEGRLLQNGWRQVVPLQGKLTM